MGEGSESHEVTLTKPFYIGVYEVTQEQYQKVMGSNPSGFKGAQNPVEQVSWEDAVTFCRKLSELPEEKSAGRVYRLPTGAEWEYACRAGTTTGFGFGDDASRLDEYAWFGDNSGRTRIDVARIWESDQDNYFDRLLSNGCQHHAVGQKKPNPWGLYDMHGNVWEWCADWYGDYPKGAVTDPMGPATGSYRVARGGSWNSEAANCGSAVRVRNSPDARSGSLGFRVALSFPEIPK